VHSNPSQQLKVIVRAFLGHSRSRKKFSPLSRFDALKSAGVENEAPININFYVHYYLRRSLQHIFAVEKNMYNFL
jgi:hypothetical protein